MIYNLEAATRRSNRASSIDFRFVIIRGMSRVFQADDFKQDRKRGTRSYCTRSERNGELSSTRDENRSPSERIWHDVCTLLFPRLRYLRTDGRGSPHILPEIVSDRQFRVRNPGTRNRIDTREIDKRK